MWNNGTATLRRDIEIRPTAVNTQSGVFMRGGSTNVNQYWYLGRGAYNIGANNFVVRSDYLPIINNGITQNYVGFQINTDGQAYFQGK